jgi:hypothetical protein
MIGQTSMSEGWLRQHPKLSAHMRQVAPESALIKEEGQEPRWMPLPRKVRMSSLISEGLVRRIEFISGSSFFLSLVMLLGVWVRMSRRSRETTLTAERNLRTLAQLITNAASDDEQKLSFSLGYAASEAPAEGDMTQDLVALDRLHRKQVSR